MVLGHEGVGIVEAVGDDVSKFKVCVHGRLLVSSSFTNLEIVEVSAWVLVT